VPVEQVGEHLRGRARRIRTHRRLAAAGPVEELLDVARRHVRRHGDDQRSRREHRDRHQILVQAVGQLGVEHAVLHHRAAGRDQQRVAVGRRLGYRVDADHGAGAGLVLHQHGGAELLRQLLGEQARIGIGQPAGREGHHDADLPRRELRALRVRRRHEEHRGGGAAAGNDLAAGGLTGTGHRGFSFNCGGPA
jgi:hypothetical protein